MTACILQVLRESPGAHVLVVTGGAHTPALRAAVARGGVQPVAPPEPPEGARVGIDLVAYSFARLDALRGYAAGMPGPEYYAGVWEFGPAEAAARAQRALIKALRAAKVAVSPADAIALATAAEGLRRLRGNDTLTRLDLLDAVRVALVKEDLVDHAGTEDSHPLLGVAERLFRGERFGRVDPSVPRPPLLASVDATFRALEIPYAGSPTEIVIDPHAPLDRERATFLHRLRLLAVPGIEWTRARPRAAGLARLERFRVVPTVELEPALLEAAAYGATPEAAAAALLEVRVANYRTAGPCAAAVIDAFRARLSLASSRMLERLERALQSEGDLGELGHAVFSLCDLVPEADPVQVAPVRELLATAVTRGLWLFESARLTPPVPGSTDPPAPPSTPRSTIAALAALREAMRVLGTDAPLPAASLTELLERYVHDAEGLPALRGAALGWLADDWTDADARLAERLAPLLLPEVAGEVLSGLFTVGREALRRVPSLAALLDGLIERLDEHAFLVALPALRAAFGALPPRERRSFGQAIAALRGVGPSAVLGRVAADATAGAAHESRLFARLSHFGLVVPS